MPPVRTTLRERITESRYLSYSLLIHAILIPILATLVLIVHDPVDDFVPSGIILEHSEITAPTPRQPVDETPKLPNEPESPAASQPRTSSGAKLITTSSPRAKLHLPSANPGVDIALTPNAGLRTGPIHGIPDTLPAALRERFTRTTGGMIAGKPGKPGPTPKTENSVLRGLNWLRDHQNADGSWGERNKGAMTGLALLCFLGHGELGDSKHYGLAVNRGFEWLIENGTKFDGRLAMTGADWGPGNGGVYEHGIATYALAEYYTLTDAFGQRDERVVELLRQAVGHIVAGQGPDGGWMYRFDKTAGDTSVSGWQIQALKAAHLTGLALPGVETTLDKAMLNLARVRGPKGGYGYRGPDDRYSLTGVGVLCELFWKGRRSADLRRAIEFISDTVRTEQPLNYTHAKADLYAWYYHTQAMLMYGGDAWAVWERRFSDEIVAAQSPDGSWPKMNAASHGNLQNSESLTGAVYRTTLCVLMLESYYRYAPTMRADHAPGPQRLAAR